MFFLTLCIPAIQLFISAFSRPFRVCCIWMNGVMSKMIIVFYKISICIIGCINYVVKLALHVCQRPSLNHAYLLFIPHVVMYLMD